MARSGERASEPADVKLIWKGGAKKDVLKPKLYVLIIQVFDQRENYFCYTIGNAERDLPELLYIQQNHHNHRLHTEFIDQYTNKAGSISLIPRRLGGATP